MLQTKCVFLKKPLETLLLAESKRSLFVSAAVKCPVMSQMLAKNNGSEKKQGTCPFSSGSISQMLTEFTSKAIHTTAVQPVKNDVDRCNADVFPYGDFFDDMINKKKEDHSYRVFRKVNRSAQKFPAAADFSFSKHSQEITVWCSNDYLGMSRHKAVVEASKRIIDENGTGAGGTRNISGTSLYHNMLEKALADWHEKEDGLLFTSCYVANDTALYTLGKMLPGCVIFSDAGNHASMIHGIRTSGARKYIFRHNDPRHLEELLKQTDPRAPKIVAFETVHSMSGAVCPLEELCDVAHRYGALTFVDEVHAVGLYGDQGAGIGDRDRMLQKMDVISGTLGKAIGCIGGYLVGKADLIDTLRSYGSGFIFTTALPPDKVFAAKTSLDILRSKEGRDLRAKHQENVKKLRTRLVRRGFPVEYAPSHIIPVLAANPDKCTKVSYHLQKHYNIYIQSINYPTVAHGDEKLRIAPTPFHTEEMMDDLVNALDEAWKVYELPYVQPACELDCNCQFACQSNPLNKEIRVLS